MDVLAVVAALSLVGLYLFSRRSRRPPQGPRAASLTSIQEYFPPELRTVAEGHSRVPANAYIALLKTGLNVGLGYTPGHDRVDVFAPAEADSPEFGAFEFSLASRRWLSDSPPDADEIKVIIKDTFPS
ncbi:MAG: hypothetical protein ACR2QM_08820 [Longimicrobiales bacterium]